MKFKITFEKLVNTTTNFLDLTVQKQNEQLKIPMYRKPTRADFTIPAEFHFFCNP